MNNKLFYDLNCVLEFNLISTTKKICVQVRDAFYKLMQIEVIWLGVGICLRQICLKLNFLCMHISFQAGLVTNKLTIALEPEAASIFCRHLSVHTAISGGNTSIAKMPVGFRYMVLDAGGIGHLY
jgi:hypothetical protein